MPTSSPSMFSVSVVVVSDYERGSEKSWDDELRVVDALAKQDIREPFEVILVENSAASQRVPERLRDLLPYLRLVFAEEDQSAKLKDYGVTHATAELIAVLEADCLPSPNWLRVLVEVMRGDPDVSVVSGRTSYGRETSYRRVLSLLDRGFDDLGKPGWTRHVSNNGALYRGSTLRRFPYPEAATPFLSSSLRNRAMMEAGHRFYFEPSVSMRHAIGGYDFLRDFRRNTGYADMKRANAGKRDVLRVLSSRFKAECSQCARLGSAYLHWYDWPLAVFLLLFVRCLELPGIIDALREVERVPKSSYR